MYISGRDCDRRPVKSTNHEKPHASSQTTTQKIQIQTTLFLILMEHVHHARLLT